MLRLLFALAILAALFFFVGVGELVSTFASLSWKYVLFLLLISVLMIWLSCLKWKIFITESVPVSRLMWMYTVGYFFNTFTPSYVGGDIARSYQLGRLIGDQTQAFAATFLERFTGLLAMCCLGVVFVALGAPATQGVELSILVVAALSVMLALVCFSTSISAFSFALARKAFARFGVSNVLLDRVQVAMEFARGNLPLFVHAMWLSFLFHVSTVVNTYVAAKAVGWQDPSVAGLFVVVPLVLLVGMLPLTPSGIGIQEGAFLFFLERIGGTSAHALSVGLVLRAKVLLIAAIGGLLFSYRAKDDI